MVWGILGFDRLAWGWTLSADWNWFVWWRLGVVVLVGWIALVGVVDKGFLTTPASLDCVEMAGGHSEVLMGSLALQITFMSTSMPTTFSVKLCSSISITSSMKSCLQDSWNPPLMMHPWFPNALAMNTPFNLIELVNPVCILTCSTNVFSKLLHNLHTMYLQRSAWLQRKSSLESCMFVCNFNKLPCIAVIWKNPFNHEDQHEILVARPTNPLAITVFVLQKICGLWWLDVIGHVDESVWSIWLFDQL